MLSCLTSVGQSGDHDATACSRGDHEAGFDDGNDGQTLRLGNHMGCKRDAIKFTPLRYDWLPLLVCGLKGMVTSEMGISILEKTMYIFRANVNKVLKGNGPTILSRLVNHTTVHRLKKTNCFFFIFLTRYKFVGSVPVGDLGEVSQDACGFLCLRLQIGQDRVTHCRQAKVKLS